MRESLPSPEDLAAWALTHFRDAPSLTLTNNESIWTFKSDQPRDGTPLTFSYDYLWRYQAKVRAQEEAAAQFP